MLLRLDIGLLRTLKVNAQCFESVGALIAAHRLCPAPPTDRALSESVEGTLAPQCNGGYPDH